MRGSYELESEQPPPELPEPFVLCEEPEDAIDTIASDLFLHAQNCVRAFGDVHLAFDGSRAAERLCQALMLDPLYRLLPWKRAHLWVVADGAHPEGASDTLRDLIAHHADLPPAQFHPMRPGDADEPDRYEARLREHLAWREPGHDRLDFVFVSADERGALPLIATNGTSGSPGLVRRAQEARGSPVVMTSTLINAARFITVMATGRESRRSVAAALADGSKGSTIAPVGGTLRWYIDRAALPRGRD
ncbi:MAG: 6-phosphogluconolactonase [Phycisphaerales bacterium]